MHIEYARSYMIQYPLFPTACRLAIKTEDERYGELPEDEKKAFCRESAERLHADNLCYSSSFMM